MEVGGRPSAGNHTRPSRRAPDTAGPKSRPAHTEWAEAAPQGDSSVGTVTQFPDSTVITTAQRSQQQSTSADVGLFGPGSVTWHIHGDATVMWVGGLRALLLQALHPLAMAGVDQAYFGSVRDQLCCTRVAGLAAAALPAWARRLHGLSGVPATDLTATAATRAARPLTRMLPTEWRNTLTTARHSPDVPHSRPPNRPSAHATSVRTGWVGLCACRSCGENTFRTRRIGSFGGTRESMMAR